MSDFSIDSILSNKADRYASSHFPWPYHPLLLHSANSFVHSHHSFGYVGLHSAPGSAAVTGNMTCEDFHFGHGERSCWSNWAHQPQPHCCPGQTVVGILGPAAMGQMGLQFLAQNGKRRRRHRTVFTEQQLEDLENLFNASSYPDSGTREKLAWKTHLSEETIKVWFKNRRAKSRKQKMPLQGKLNSPSTCNAMEEAGKYSVHPSVAS